MTIKLKNVSSGNFSSETIPVEFVVLHYTACSLEDTLKIFCNPERQVCAHFVLDLDGTVYDLGDFWSSEVRKGAHAGKSHFDLDGKRWEGLNSYSIGIEIVNYNGNVIPFTDEQYDSLGALVRHLRSRFEILNKPERMIGHEHIAGFRGKVDPGICFDWKRFFASVYPELPSAEFPKRSPVLTKDLWNRFEKTVGKPVDKLTNQPVTFSVNQMNQKQIEAVNWSELSAKLEKFVGDLNSSSADMTHTQKNARGPHEK